MQFQTRWPLRPQASRLSIYTAVFVPEAPERAMEPSLRVAGYDPIRSSGLRYQATGS